MTIITGRVGDSAAQNESGRIEFAQAQRFDNGELMVTQSIAVAQVLNGELRTLAGAAFSLPPNIAGSAVRVREILGGRTYEWWAAVPDAASVEYRELPVVQSSSVPASVWGPPPWLAVVEQLRDDTLAAIEDGKAVADALGGLAGITGAVEAAQSSAEDSATSAGQAADAVTAATAQAERAEAAADSIDMTQINTRLDGVDNSIEVLAGEVSGKADATTVEAELAKLRRVDPVEGVTLYSYGHSYTIQPGPYSTPNGGEYQLRLAKRLSLGPVFSRGRSGTPAMDTFAMALGPSWGGTNPLRTWTPGACGIVTLQNYMNEASSSSGSDALYRSAWLQSMRSFIALASSKSVQSVAAGTRAGTWTQFSNSLLVPAFANADVWFSSTVGSTISFTVSGDEAWVIGISARESYSSGRIGVVCNGVTVSTITTQGTLNEGYASLVEPTLTNYTPMAYKVTGLNAAAGTTGNKTIVLRVLDAKNTFINGVIQPSAVRPAIFVAQEPPRNPGATGGTAAFNANDPWFRSATEQLATEFPNVYVVDLRPGWDNSRFVGSLDTVHKFHPNDLGMQHIASKFEQAIRARITAPADGVMVL